VELIKQTVAAIVRYLRGFPLFQEERCLEIKLAFLDKGISISILDKQYCRRVHLTEKEFLMGRKQLFLQITQEGCKSIGIKICYWAHLL